MIFNQRKCPSCNQKIKLMDIKKEFKCKGCGKNLKSNALLILVVCVVISGVSGAILSTVFGGHDWLFDVLVFLLVFPLISNKNMKIRESRK